MNNNIVYQGDKYEIKFDKQGGFYHLYPLPTSEELKKYYSEEFYKNNKSQLNDSAKEVQEEENEFISMQYADILEIIERESPGKKIIDIGCGYGNFLKFCRDRDYEVFGLDPSPEAVADANKNGINALTAEIEEAGSKLKEKYDAVVMLNVLEHLRKPCEVLEDIKNNILTDGGILIIRVPNEFNKLQTISNKEYNLKSWWVSAPQHINYFTVPHLVNLINKAGFEVFLKESSFPLEMFILFGEQYVGDPVLGKIIHKKRVNFEKAIKKNDNDFKRKLYQQFAELGIGREITIYARKK